MARGDGEFEEAVEWEVIVYLPSITFTDAFSGVLFEHWFFLTMHDILFFSVVF